MNKRITSKTKSLGLKEKHIENATCLFLRSKGVFFWKTISTGYFDSSLGRFRRQASPWALKGAPDIICVVDGRFIGLEIKGPTGRQSDDQKAFEERLRKAGGEYFIVRSIDDVERIFSTILKK